MKYFSIEQVDYEDCGPTALKMLLAYLHQEEGFLFLQEQWQRPSSMKELLMNASHFGVTLKGYKLHHPSSVRGIKKPFIALMKNPHPHYVTIVPFKRHKYLLMDPIGNSKRVTEAYFLSAFTGFILLVKHVKRMDSPFSAKQAIFFRGFFTVSGLIYLSLLILWLYATKEWWMLTSSIMVVAGIAWLIYVFSRIKFFDDWMLKRYLHLIQDHQQFIKFHQWKKGFIVFPFRRFYRMITSISVIIYLSVASPIFLIPYGLFQLVTLLWLPPLEKHKHRKILGIEKQEQHLKFPHLKLKEMKTMYHEVYQVMAIEYQNWGLAFALIIVLVSGFSLLEPYQDFLSWVTMITLLLFSFQHHQTRIQEPGQLQQWRQQGYAFLNQKKYDKINS